MRSAELVVIFPLLAALTSAFAQTKTASFSYPDGTDSSVVKHGENAIVAVVSVLPRQMMKWN